MKKVFLVAMTIVLFVACQEKEQRYFSESAEINTLKAGIASYEAGDWTTWKSHFADTAKVYVNSDKSISVDARVTNLKETASAFSKYGFDNEEEFVEMVLDKENDTWVYYWAQHNATIAGNNKQLSIPVHLAVQFVDGKIVEEHVFFDGTEMNKEIEALANLSTDEKAIQTSINKITKAWNANDKDMMASALTENFVRTENGTTVAKNPEDYAGFMDIYHGAFPDFKVTIDKTVIDGNKAYMNWTCTGTNTGNFLENEPTGKTIKTQGFSVWIFDKDGKSIQEDAFYDNLVVFNQLGIVPPKQ